MLYKTCSLQLPAVRKTRRFLPPLVYPWKNITDSDRDFSSSAQKPTHSSCAEDRPATQRNVFRIYVCNNAGYNHALADSHSRREKDMRVVFQFCAIFFGNCNKRNNAKNKNFSEWIFTKHHAATWDARSRKAENMIVIGRKSKRMTTSAAGLLWTEQQF